MELHEKNRIRLENIRKLQESFDESMKILESHVAESITNKAKLDSMKKDLKQANNKFIEAVRYLEELKVDLENTIIR